MFDDADLPDWMEKNNQKRTEEYSRNQENEIFLRHLNNLLRSYEDQIKIPESEPNPVIFFFGLPRIGKTMFSQLICHSLNTGYPDNVVARFWKAPVYGIYLSDILGVSDIETDFKSDIGKTSNLSEPHDFAYFWHDWLEINPREPYNYDMKKEEIDWKGLSNELKRMSQKWGKTAVFKGVLPSYQIPSIAKHYEKSFFIYIERDYIDSALSFLEAKRKTFNDSSAWFGQLPSEEVYEELDDKPYHKKIAGHFKALVDHYENELSLIDQKRWLRLNYKDICNNPKDIIKDIVFRIRKLWEEKIQFRNEPPESFEPSIHHKDEEDYNKMAAALEKEGLPLRLKDRNKRNK